MQLNNAIMHGARGCQFLLTKRTRQSLIAVDLGED